MFENIARLMPRNAEDPDYEPDPAPLAGAASESISVEPLLEPLPTGAASDEAAQLPGAGRGSAETGSLEAGTGGILEINSAVNTLNPDSEEYLPISKVEAWLRGDIRLSSELKQAILSFGLLVVTLK